MTLDTKRLPPHSRKVATLVFLAVLLTFDFALADSKLTYHGWIIRPDGTPLDGQIEFKVQIRTPGDVNCLLYEETQTKTVNSGIFALNIGESENKSGVGSLERVFQNHGTFTNLSNCEPQSPTSYTASANDGRRLRVYFRESAGGDWEAIPETTINFVPLAIEAQSVGGFGAKNLLRVVEDGGGEKSADVGALTRSQFDELMNWLTNGLLSGGGGGGAVTSITAQDLLVIGGTAANPQISIPKADTNTDGYLSAADWKKFDEKQPAGNYITELTGDVVAQGPVGGGAAPTTIQDKVVTFNKIQDV